MKDRNILYTVVEETDIIALYKLARYVNRITNYRDRYSNVYDTLVFEEMSDFAKVFMCAFMDHYGGYSWFVERFPEAKKCVPFDKLILVTTTPSALSETLKKWNVWW